jgi:alginate O-acetyltransferase complex protein AlgI
MAWRRMDLYRLGGFNGMLLSVNHLWRVWRGPTSSNGATNFFGWLTTFTAFAVGMVFFRAADLPAAVRLLEAMIGQSAATPSYFLGVTYDHWGINHGYLPGPFIISLFGSTWSVVETIWLFAVLFVALVAPETIEFANYREGDPHSRWRRQYPGFVMWRMSIGWLLVVVTLFFFLSYRINQVSEFLYYQF